jgi:hypothetical protein
MAQVNGEGVGIYAIRSSTDDRDRQRLTMAPAPVGVAA